MRFGITLPQFGTVAAAGQIGEFARQAEDLGYESLWVGDRALAPLRPSQPYPGYTEENPLPPAFGKVDRAGPGADRGHAGQALADDHSGGRGGRDPGSLRRELRVNLSAGPDPVAEALTFMDEARKIGYDGAFADPQFTAGGLAEMTDYAGQLMAGYRAG